MKAERCREQYLETTERIDAIRSTLGGDGMPHGSGISRKTENLAIKLAEAAEVYIKAEEEAQAIKEQVEDTINSLPPGMSGVVLYERYINLSKWEDIAKLLHYSLRGILKIHGQALIEVDTLIQKEKDK